MSHESALNAILSLLAENIPEEMLLELLQSALDEYKEIRLLNKPEKEKKDAFHKLSTICLLILQKSSGQSAMESIEAFDKFQKVKELIKNQPQ